MNITRTNEKIYIKQFANGAQQVFKRRMPCDVDEKIYFTNMYTICANYEDSHNNMLEFESAYNKGIYNMYNYVKDIVANELHVSEDSVKFLDNYAYYLTYYRDNKYACAGATFYLDCELEELTPNKADEKYRKKMETERHNTSMLKTFGKGSMEAIISKYGVVYDERENKLVIDKSELNHILYEMYSKMIDELNAIGIKTKIKEQIISLDNSKVLVNLTRKNSVTLELNGGAIGNDN